MALQGSLDTFALPDVLRLLATTAKTGRLRVEGDRGQGSVWLRDGTVMAAAADRAVDDAPAEEVLFELLRFEQGAFAFEADELSPNGETPEDVEILLRDAAALLTEWNELEKVVPSLDCKVDLVDTLPKGDVTIEANRWPSIVAVASGRTVREVASSLGMSELAATRAVRDLVDLGVASVGEPSDEPSDEPLLPAAQVPPEDRARRSPFGSLGSGEQLATSVPPRDTGESGWMQSPERAGSGGPSIPDGLTSGVSGIGRSGANGTGSGSPAPGLTPRSGRSGSAGKRTTGGSSRSSGSKRSGTAGRSPSSRRDSAAGAGAAGAGAAGGGGATGSASGPGEPRRSTSSRDGGELRRSTPSAQRDPSGEFRRPTPSVPRDPSGEFRRPTPSVPRDPSGEFRRPTPSVPRDPSGEFRRPTPSAPRDPSGEFRRPPSTGPGYESRPGKSRPTSPRRSGGPATPPPVLPDTGPLSMPPVSPAAFDAGPLGPSPLPADTGQIRPVSPNALPPDLQWAVDDQAAPGVPPAGPLGGRGLGNGMVNGNGLGNGLGNGFPNGSGGPGNGNGLGNGAPTGGGVPLDPHKVAPHVAAMSPEARAAVQGTVGNTGGSSGGFGPGDDLASRGQLLNFLSSVRP